MNALRNYRTLLLSNTILSFGIGLFMPFYIIFLQDIGGSIESFSFAIGLMALAQAITSYLAGKYSDKLGRKSFMLVAGFIIALITLSYLWVQYLWQLYVLQVIFGIAQAIQLTMETTVLGDVTIKAKRGHDIGTFHAITGVVTAFAMMGAGLLAGRIGIDVVFYIATALFLVSTIALFYFSE